MIVYNTTFHADDAFRQQFLDWVKSEFVPRALSSGTLSEPRLTKVLVTGDDNGSSYSLQFRAGSLDDLSRWYEEVGNDLMESLTKKFGNAVAGFSTLLEEVEL